MNCIPAMKPKDLIPRAARLPARRMPAPVLCPPPHRGEMESPRGSRKAVGVPDRAPTRLGHARPLLACPSSTTTPRGGRGVAT